MLRRSATIVKKISFKNPEILWVKNKNLICMIVVYSSTIYGAGDIPPLPCSLETISQKQSFWGPWGLGYPYSQVY